MMKLLAALTVITLAWAARQSGKENGSEEHMPETVWIGSPYGLIPYDIDWAYFNKTKEHVLRESKRGTLKTVPHKASVTTLLSKAKPSNESKSNSTLDEALVKPSPTIEQLTTPISTTCNDDEQSQEESTKSSSKPTEATVTSTLPSTAVPRREVISRVRPSNRSHLPRKSHKASATIPHRPNRNQTTHSPSKKQRTFPRIPYDIDDLLISSTMPSVSDVDPLEKTKSQKTNETTVTDDAKVVVKGDKKASSKPKSREHASEGKSKSAEQHEVTASLEEGSYGSQITEVTAEANNGEVQSNTVSANKQQSNGNCDKLSDILTPSDSLQIKIVDSLLKGSKGWPRKDRGHFRGMVNHLRRRLQAMPKKTNDSEQFKSIRFHINKYIADHPQRKPAVMLINIPPFGTVQQLLNCFNKHI